MSKRRLAALVLVAGAALGACSSSNDSDTGTSSASIGDTEVAVGAAPLPGVGSVGDAIEVAAGAPGDASAAACTVDRQTLELAAETYELLNSAAPTSQQELLDAQMIRELSVRYEIGTDGAVVPTPGSPCT